MSDGNIQEVFVERISNVAHANGVFRITLGVNEDVNNVRPSTRLLVPANQLGPILQGIANAARDIGEQIQFTKEDDPTTQEEKPEKSKSTTTRRAAPKAASKKASKTASKTASKSRKKS